MDAAIKKKWIRALRSGKYKQGKNALRIGDKHCCLGVLCELAFKAGAVQRTEQIHGRTSSFSYGGDYLEPFGSMLPESVMEWAGLDNTAGVEWEDDNGDVESLITLNDGGKTFKEIAKVINEKL